MKRIFKKLSLCAIPCMLLSLPLGAHAWTTTINCEGGTLNTVPANTSVSYWGTNTRLSSEQAASGAQSCKFSIKKGSEGWPSTGGALEWGGIFDFPAPVAVGQEVWVRLSLFVPAGFQIVANSGQLKFIRLHTRTSTANTGCLDMYMGDPKIPLWDPILKKDTFPPFDTNFEGVAGLSMVGLRPTDDVAMGKWETYEIYVKVDSVSEKNGGMGVERVWKNNKLLINATHQVSAVNKTGIIDSAYIFTYWNGTAPADQYVYMDDLIMTTDRPTNKDANGYTFIGGSVTGGTTTPITPVAPTAPSGVVAKPI